MKENIYIQFRKSQVLSSISRIGDRVNSKFSLKFATVNTPWTTTIRRIPLICWGRQYVRETVCKGTLWKGTLWVDTLPNPYRNNQLFPPFPIFLFGRMMVITRFHYTGPRLDLRPRLSGNPHINLPRRMPNNPRMPSNLPSSVHQYCFLSSW